MLLITETFEQEFPPTWKLQFDRRIAQDEIHVSSGFRFYTGNPKLHDETIRLHHVNHGELFFMFCGMSLSVSGHINFTVESSVMEIVLHESGKIWEKPITDWDEGRDPR